MKKNLLTPNDFYAFSKREDAIILDASMPKPGKQTSSEEPINSIPGALKFDISNDFSDQEASFPNTYPGDKELAIKLGELGVSNNSTVLIYDDKGLYSAPRVWFMLKRLGHDKVYVLDGGLPNWINQGFETANLYIQPQNRALFEYTVNPKFEFINTQELLKLKELEDYSLLDARSKDRFQGRVAEPRPEVRSGHIPKSINLPFTDLLEEGILKSIDQIDMEFKDLSQNLIFSCGSGITACVLALAADELGRNNLKVYDGSWTEYGSSNHPIEKD